MTTEKEDHAAAAPGAGDSPPPNEALANLVVDELSAGGLVRPEDRSRLLEGLVAGKVDGSTWRKWFENALEAGDASDATR